MSNRFTRVPEGPVPPLPRLLQVFIPPADLFMLAMVSRPATGSLRTTWVTPATLQLGLAVGVVGLALAFFALYRGLGGAGVLAVAGGVLLLLLGIGAGSVAIVGAAQRRAAGQR
ncbi:MAG TPA: hypothetical protein VIP52_11015 [Candidatus Dormibacteraeota bacterium]